MRNNPFPRKTCGQIDCPINDCKDNCSKESVLYTATCIKCEENTKLGGKPTYIGETSRTVNIRANQHRKDCTKVIRQDPDQLVQEPLLRKSDCSSWMIDHHRREHSQEPPPDLEKDFRFKVLAKHKDPMSRQVEEACRIAQALEQKTLTTNSGKLTSVISLNRKGESFAPRSRPEYFN